MEFSATVMSVQALGFATSAALCAMLLFTHYQLRARDDGAAVYAWLWISGLIYASSAFAATMLRLATPAVGPRALSIAESIVWTSTCIGPLVFVTIGDVRLADGPVRRVLNALAVTASVLLVVRLLLVAIETDLRVGDTAYPAEAFYVSIGFALLTLGAVMLRGRPRAEASGPRWFVPVATGLVVVQAIATIISIHDFAAGSRWRPLIGLISVLWILPWTVLLAFRLAQTRYADVALKRSLAFVASVCAAGVLVACIPNISHLVFVIATLAVAAFAACVSPVHRALDGFIDRVLLGRPDYRRLQLEFGGAARRIADADTLTAAAATLVGDTLRVDAHFVPATSRSTSNTLGFFPTGRDCALEVRASSGMRSLMREELAFLAAIAAEVGHRLESLSFEAERREAQARESQLQRSLIEAELRALRAQVDPHFLFNTLNTIADLTTRNPEQAEAMTERLAECFRYTLSRQDQTLSTLEEELQFVRRYLDIERIRFGDRLTVHVNGDEGVRQERVPSLILQPLVENAVRHGLAAKPGGGTLRVTANDEGEFLRLTVSDDGVGIAARPTQRRGIGLANVRERLQALYRERAEISIGAGEAGRGTSITLRVPKHAC